MGTQLKLNKDRGDNLDHLKIICGEEFSESWTQANKENRK